jgi:hypothetical protein
VAESRREFSEDVSFRENRQVLAIVDRLANLDGQQRTHFIRGAIRDRCKKDPRLTDEEKKVLGIEIKST